jgi:hypothetical protein
MIKRFIAYLKALGRKRKTYSMAIVRRYTDANGAFVGELYLLGTFAGILGYQMIGVSLDTLPLEAKHPNTFDLDIENDFLKPMTKYCIRVGAIDPADNENVRKHVASLFKTGKIEFQIQNRFIEHILGKKA